MVSWECRINPREASGLDPEAVHYGRRESLFSVAVRAAADRPVLTVVGLLAAFCLWRFGRRWLRRS
jgi:hypothetical protein